MMSKIVQVILSINLLLLTGCTSDIDFVKSGFLNDFSKSVTVGNAFDNYKYCVSPKWEEFETEQKEKIVRFTCSLPIIVESLNEYREAKKRPLIEKKDQYLKAIDNNDETFAKKEFDAEMDNVEVLLKDYLSAQNRYKENSARLKELKAKRIGLQIRYSESYKLSLELREVQNEIEQVKRNLNFADSELQTLSKDKNTLKWLARKSELESIVKNTYVDFLRKKINLIEAKIDSSDEDLRRIDPSIFVKSVEFTTDFSISQQDSTFAVKGMWTDFCWEDNRCREVHHNDSRSVNSVSDSLTIIYGNDALLWGYNANAFMSCIFKFWIDAGK